MTLPGAVNDTNLGLFTDLYEMTMLQAYWAEGMHEPAVFSLFFRELPEERNFMLACGQGELLETLRSLHFPRATLDRLADLDLFREDFLRHMEGFRFTGDVHAVPEGTPIFPQEPIIEIEAPLGEAQVIESLVMNQIHVQSVLASNAIRFRLAAGEEPALVDFGLRRMHGTDAAMRGVRAYWIAGLDATSNILGGIDYGVPVRGTMAHSYIQAHDREDAAFEAFANLYPGTVLLVDTYDTLAGVQKVIDLVTSTGATVSGLRLDSGDLLTLSRETRRMLDDAGLSDIGIFASGGLDEYKVQNLMDKGAPIDGFGVGTHLGASPAAPALDLAYKLTEYAGTPRTKHSPGKEIYPGKKQIWRVDAGNSSMHDVLSRRDEEHEGTALLQPAMRDGEILNADFADHHLAREYCRQAVANLPAPLRKLDTPDTPYRVEVSRPLKDALAALAGH